MEMFKRMNHSNDGRRQLLCAVLALACGTLPSYGTEWDCASTSGVFELSTDCTMSNEVAVSGELTVRGQETVYSTLTAASGKGHFKITIPSGVHTLRLKWLNLTGGDVTGNGPCANRADDANLGVTCEVVCSAGTYQETPITCETCPVGQYQSYNSYTGSSCFTERITGNSLAVTTLTADVDPGNVRFAFTHSGSLISGNTIVLTTSATSGKVFTSDGAETSCVAVSGGASLALSDTGIVSASGTMLTITLNAPSAAGNEVVVTCSANLDANGAAGTIVTYGMVTTGYEPVVAGATGYTTRGVWNCTSATPEPEGIFECMADCTMTSAGVQLSGDLSITGRPELTTITAKTSGSRRHFYIPGIQTLTLKWLRLTGGSMTGVYPNDRAGSIRIHPFSPGPGTLHATSCVFFDNHATGDGGAIAATACLNCTAGKYLSDEATNATQHFTEEQCIVCDGGRWSLEGAGTCTTCPAGMATLSLNGNAVSTCRACGAGKYLEDNGEDPSQHDDPMTDCKLCAKGRSSAATILVTECECEKCRPGMFAPIKGSSNCTACPLGQYQDGVGADSCKACPPKYETLAAGASICTENPDLIATLEGVPPSQSINQGEGATYAIRLSTLPTALVSVKLDLDAAACTVPQQVDFAQNNYTAPSNIIVQTLPRTEATAKGSVVGVCTIRHNIESNDSSYAALSAQMLVVSIISQGCGVGEYRGDEIARQNNGTECICSARFYKPYLEDCKPCPEEGLVCEAPGVKTPDVAIGFWRYDPSSQDFERFPIYECVIPASCVGGNSTSRRCARGYDDASPLCAVCDSGYVFQQGICVPCPGYSADGATTPTLQLLTAVFSCSILGMCFMYWYFTMPVLTRKEETDLRVKLSMLDIDTIYQKGSELSLEKFSELMDDSHGALTEKEIEHLFHVVDDDGSNSIDRTELLDYITNKGTCDIEQMQGNKPEMESRIEKNAALSSTVGGAMMKFKILVTYAQCMSLMPVVFSLPFPSTMVMLMKLLEFSSLDIYVVFGEVSCHMYTGFMQKFIFHILLLPLIVLSALIVYKIVLVRRKSRCSTPRFTEESVKTQVYTLGSLVAYGLYTGLSTRIFRVFKCDKVQDRYYLTADYSVECYGSNWWVHGSLAIVCMFVYVIGIPLVQFIVLWKNYAHLHESSALDQQAHRLVKKQFGSLYESYTEECFYFELIDLFRRLMMTAGLILVRQSSVVQALLGTITSLSWLLLVAIKFPYKAYWDNVLQIVLSSALLVSLISGMALKLFRLDQHRKDDFEQAFFDILLITLTAGCITLGLLGLAITLPCCADRFTNFLSKRRKTTTFSVLKQWAERQRVVVKWLIMKDMQNMLALWEKSLAEKALVAAQVFRKERRQSKIQMSVVHPQVVPVNALPELTGEWEDTKELLGKIIQSLPLEEKLLKRPPFRYLHDIILAVNRATNFFAGLYNEDETNPLMVREKEGIERWRWKMIILVKAITTVNHFYNTSLEVHPRKIIAGEEGDLTNKFLQAIAHAALSGVSSDVYVQRTLDGAAGMALSYRLLSMEPKEQGGPKKRAIVRVVPVNALPELTGEWDDTKELLGKIIQSLPLEEKLLKRPPFRYLHDIILAVNRATNFFAGLYNEDETNPLMVREKEGIERWRWKMIILVKAITTVNHFYNTSLEVHPRKIIAGEEGDLTNKFLQAIAHAALSGVSSDVYVQRTLDGATDWLP
eukprot:g1515.t1